MEWLCVCAKLQASASFALYFDLKSHDFNDMVGEHYVPLNFLVSFVWTLFEMF